jgi:hypothetical protein
MESISLKKITLVGFLGPIIIIIGGFISVVLGRGQAIMLPTTVAALTFYGVLIALGAAWRDGAPRLFRWTSGQPFLFVAVLGAGMLALIALAWLAATQGVSGLLWRPLLTPVICVWLGICLASIVPPRVSA